jgi:hypothetical protein
MANILSFLMLIIFAATGVAWVASAYPRHQGHEWAEQVCTTAQTLCEQPTLGLAVLAVVGLAYFAALMIES